MMTDDEICKIARRKIDNLNYDLSIYSEKEQKLIRKAIAELEIRTDAKTEEDFLERRGRF